MPVGSGWIWGPGHHICQGHHSCHDKVEQSLSDGGEFQHHWTCTVIPQGEEQCSQYRPFHWRLALPAQVHWKVFSKFEEATQAFSSNKSLSMPQVIPSLINLKGYLSRWLQNPPDFAIQGQYEGFKRLLNNAWPGCAISEREPAMAHLFHPHYCSVLL